MHSGLSGRPEGQGGGCVLPAPSWLCVLPHLLFHSGSVIRLLLFTQHQHYFYTSAKALPDPLPLKRTLINPLIMAGMQETARVGRDGAAHGPTAVTICGSESWGHGLKGSRRTTFHNVSALTRTFVDCVPVNI